MDTGKAFAALTTETGISLIKATSVEQFVLSPITFWCEIHAPPQHQDPLDPYRQYLFEVGHDHQSAVIDESYFGAVQKLFYDEEEGVCLTLEIMSSGERFIKNMPLMCLSIGLQGRPDLLVRVDGPGSELGPYAYSDVEIKTVRYIQRAHILQGAVYNRLLGIAQGYEPAEFHMINRDGNVQTIQMADVASDLDGVLSDMREIMNGKPVEPCYGAGEWPWESHVNSLAIARNDISLIPGIGLAKREGLIGAGIRTVDDIAAAPEPVLTNIRGVGKTTARKFTTSAKAIYQGHPIRREIEVQVPTAQTEVFVDLEGTDSRIGTRGPEVVNYLIGALVRSPDLPPTYISFFASSFEDEERILREFFEWGASIGDAIFCHWHNYERTHLQKMTDYYGLGQDKVAPVMERLKDLQPIATKAFAFPSYGEGLKDIAKSLGFNWRQDDVTALTSVALYFKYIGSNGTDEESRQKIVDYNEDDCRATMHVHDWLLAQERKPSSGQDLIA